MNDLKCYRCNLWPCECKDGIALIHGDCRTVLTYIAQPNVCLTDPVWPNSIYSDIENPEALFGEVASMLSCDRLIVQLGCDSDPRFMRAVPDRLRFVRACWLEYVRPSYKGRILYTGDVAYVFGSVPPSRSGARVLPGKVISTRSDRLFHRKIKHRDGKWFSRQRADQMPHPSPRRLQHVRWLVKWFIGDGDSVIDPFVGSGTTALACKIAGVPCVGIEREEKYLDVAAKRLEQGVLDFEGAEA